MEQQKIVLPYAQDMPRWDSGKRGIGVLVDEIRKELAKIGTKASASGTMETPLGEIVYVMFKLDGEVYRPFAPILPLDPARKHLKLRNQASAELAAESQAATYVFEDVRQRCIHYRIQGARIAFGGYRLIDAFRTEGQVSVVELQKLLPEVAT